MESNEEDTLAGKGGQRDDGARGRRNPEGGDRPDDRSKRAVAREGDVDNEKLAKENPAANRADWALPEGGGSREEARERVREGADSADDPPPGGRVGGTGATDPTDHRHREQR